MTGKEKCNLLKQIRKEIADRNGIAFEPAECNFQGNCSGTCPKCDEEIRYLDAQINKKAELGGRIRVAGVKLSELEVDNNIVKERWVSPFGGPREGSGRNEIFSTMGVIVSPPNDWGEWVEEEEDDWD